MKGRIVCEYMGMSDKTSNTNIEDLSDLKAVAKYIIIAVTFYTWVKQMTKYEAATMVIITLSTNLKGSLQSDGQFDWKLILKQKA